MTDVIQNAAAHRFELHEDGHLAIAEYRLDGGVMTLTHTRVPEALGGRGVGSRLIAGALAAARAHGLRIVPECSFVAAYIERHPETRDLLA